MKLRNLLIAGAALVAVSGTAAANGNIGWSISIGIPGPVYPAPAPVYVPQPAYYPPVAVYPPAPAYYPPRVVYAPAPYYGGYRWRERAWREHEWREHERHGRGWR